MDSPAAVMSAYVDACRRRDVAALRDLFSPSAVMVGRLAGEYLAGSLEPFFSAVATAPVPQESYCGTIEENYRTDNTASMLLREENYLGMNFQNSFHLVRWQGRWWIVHKLFESSPSIAN